MYKKDSLKINDSALILSNEGELFMSHESGKIIGELEIQERDIMNNILFTSKEYNDVVLTGSTFILEQMFKQRSTIGISTLSVDMGINSAVQPTVNNLKDEYVFGFMVGIGGATDSSISDVKAINYTDKKLSSVVPFRVTVSPLSAIDGANYLMKTTKTFANDPVPGTKYCYYAKKFSADNPVRIRHLFTDGTEVPSNISDTGTSKGIRTFGEMTCDITKDEIREYFRATENNSIANCRINTLGLVAGFMDTATSEIAGVRLITAINFKSRFLDNDANNIRIIYRVYCV